MNKAEILISLNNKQYIIPLPQELADILCKKDEWPTFESFPKDLVIYTTKKSGCGNYIIYEMMENGGYKVHFSEEQKL